jgi:hypothetical protein
MDRKIIIYGMGDFSEPDELKRYIETDVFDKDGGRFDYPQEKNADVIVLSLRGKVYGHFNIAGEEKPTDEEMRRYPTAKAIYIVEKPTTLYEIPVELLPLGIKGIQFGKPLSEEQFEQIQVLAGNSARDLGGSHGEETRREQAP